jgi:hypothetical protein
VYSRRYDGRDLHFEASGGLVNSSLILQDRGTNSYWSIMKGKSTAGQHRGTSLVELPGTKKTRWMNWARRHPDTRVLSVGGREHAEDSYAGYWEDPQGFRGQAARDSRLSTKTPIFAFERRGHRVAIAHERIEGGYAGNAPSGELVFFFRPKRASMFESTTAFVSRAGFVLDAKGWTELESGAVFDTQQGIFRGGEVEPLNGLDTFWYNWSLNNPTTKLMR